MFLLGQYEVQSRSSASSQRKRLAEVGDVCYQPWRALQVPVGTLQASVPHICTEREHMTRDPIPRIRRCLQRFDSEAMSKISTFRPGRAGGEGRVYRQHVSLVIPKSKLAPSKKVWERPKQSDVDF
jgi:hypothetical protein